MQVEEVRRPVIGLKQGEIFLLEMFVFDAAGIEGEQEGIVGIVAVSKEHPA